MEAETVRCMWACLHGARDDDLTRSGTGRRPGRGPECAQHSTMLTARPPREVSLYLIFMSAPVSIMVLTTLSRLTVCVPSPCRASRAAVIAFTEATAFRSMQGI